jgi:hypothetical protein
MTETELYNLIHESIQEYNREHNDNETFYQDNLLESHYIIIHVAETKDSLGVQMVAMLEPEMFDKVQRMKDATGLRERSKILAEEVSFAAAVVSASKGKLSKAMDKASEEAINAKNAAEIVGDAIPDEWEDRFREDQAKEARSKLRVVH